VTAGWCRPAGSFAEFALFDMLETLPASTLVSIVAIVLILTFLITSVDSGSFVLAMLSHGGDPEPPRWIRLLWAVIAGAAAAALMLSGGLVPLQTAVILMAIPFSVIMIGIGVATAKAFYAEAEQALRAQRLAERRALAEQIRETVRIEHARVEAEAAHRRRLPEVTLPQPRKLRRLRPR